MKLTEAMREAVVNVLREAIVNGETDLITVNRHAGESQEHFFDRVRCELDALAAKRKTLRAAKKYFTELEPAE